MSKYPGLGAAARRNGIAYMTAYQRMNYGWSFERATTEPTHRASPKPLKPPKPPKPPKPLKRKLAQREDAYTARWMKEYLRPQAEAQRAERKPNDSSPPHIQALRAAFCDEFVKTGVINTELQSQLKEYADERRAAKDNSRRVSADPEAQRHRGRPPRVGDDSGGGRSQIEPGTAELIRNFIRS